MGRRGPVQGRASITDIYNETTMTRIHTIARTGFIAALLALSAPLFAAEGWTTLFNGRDLTGWTTWVSMQPTSDNMKAPTSVRGANHDPKHVFSVVDGMLRVSGEEWGAVSTVGDYENFHLKFDVKWGEKMVPAPRSAARQRPVVLRRRPGRGAERALDAQPRVPDPGG